MPKPYYHQPKSLIDQIVRVNHAGEFGAKRIYQGQITASNNLADKELFRKMLAQEAKHLAYFEQLVAQGKARPTLLLPLWQKLGYLLGLASTKLGLPAAMLVTEKVEEVIIEHYQEQINILLKLLSNNKLTVEERNFLTDLLANLQEFQQDEAEHLHIAIENDSNNSIMHDYIANIVKRACYLAINLSKKI